MNEKKEYTMSIGKNAGEKQGKEDKTEHQAAIRTSATVGEIWRKFGEKNGK